jgi:hypothetical protein
MSSGNVVVATPRSIFDQKPLTRSSMYTLGTRLYITGCGDDRDDGTGKGQRFEKQHANNGLSSWVEWHFNDWVELGGGGMWYTDAKFGDFVRFRMYAPATVITATPGTGNCNIHPTAGILIPAAGDGEYTVDLETADQAVPLLSASGMWDWSYPSTGVGVVTPNYDGKGNCQLVPQAVPIHTYVADVGLLGDNYLNVTFPGVDPTRFLPQWKMGCQFFNCDGEHVISLVWELEVARMNGAVSY